MVSFILGLLIGTFCGMVILSMCMAAKQADQRKIIDAHAEDVEESTPSKEA